MADLSLATLKAAMDDLNRRFPPPDVWIYGIRFGDGLYGGPFGCSFVDAARLIASGWAYFEGPTGRVYWTARAWHAFKASLPLAPPVPVSRYRDTWATPPSGAFRRTDQEEG